jgi:copper chaperone CopZ
MHQANCHVEMIEKPFGGDPPEGISRARMQVSGMGCPNCAARVHNSLLQLDGVFGVDVAFESGLARVIYDGEQIAPKRLMQAVEIVGRQSNHDYQAELIN